MNGSTNWENSVQTWLKTNVLDMWYIRLNALNTGQRVFGITLFSSLKWVDWVSSSMWSIPKLLNIIGQ